MSDNTVLNPGASGDVLATDDIGGVKFPRGKLIHGADGVNDGDVSRANPFPVDLYSVVSPIRTHATSASLSAAGSTDLDSSQITSARVGKLLQIVVTSSLPIKIELKTVTNAIESATLMTLFSIGGMFAQYTTPHKDVFTVAHDAGAGLDAFRVTVTNLDAADPGDVYATFVYDETT